MTSALANRIFNAILLFLVFTASSSKKYCCQKDKDKEIIVQKGDGLKSQDDQDNTSSKVDEQMEELKRSHKAVVKQYLAQHRVIQRGDVVGQSPVFIAAWTDYFETAKFLAAQGFDFNLMNNYTSFSKIFLLSKSKYGHPLIYVAAEEGYQRIVEMLIESDVNLEENLLSIAKTEDIKDMIGKAIDKKYHQDFLKAVRKGHTKKVKLLAQNVDLNRDFPVCIAAAKGHTDIIQFFADQSRFLSINFKFRGHTYHTKVFKPDEKIVDQETIQIEDRGRVKAHRATINVTTPKPIDLNNASNGCTRARSLTAFQKWKMHKDDAKFFAAQKVDLNLCSYPYGRSPIYIAADKGHKEIVKILIDSDVHLEDNLLHVAATQDVYEIISEALKN